jgi:hypothetical protein
VLAFAGMRLTHVRALATVLLARVVAFDGVRVAIR